MRFEVHIHHVDSSGVERIRLELSRLFNMGQHIMSKITDAVNAQKAAFGRLEASLAGIGEDIASLAAKIEELQSSAGTVTPEDQALLDEASAMADNLATRFEEVDALTSATAPVPDPSPPV